MRLDWLVAVCLTLGACAPTATAPAAPAPPPGSEAALGLTAEQPARRVAEEALPEEQSAPEGPFSSEAVRDIVRAHFDDLVPCYVEGRQRVEGLQGTIEVRMSIGGDGRVIEAHAETAPSPTKGELIVDEEVVACVTARFEGLRFPETGQGIVNMIYPVVFAVE